MRNSIVLADVAARSIHVHVHCNQQDLKKVPPGSPGQVDFLTGQSSS